MTGRTRTLESCPWRGANIISTSFFAFVVFTCYGDVGNSIQLMYGAGNGPRFGQSTHPTPNAAHARPKRKKIKKKKQEAGTGVSSLSHDRAYDLPIHGYNPFHFSQLLSANPPKGSQSCSTLLHYSSVTSTHNSKVRNRGGPSASSASSPTPKPTLPCPCGGLMVPFA